MTPKELTTKVKLDILGYTSNLKTCTSKDTTNRMKRQPRERQKLFANHISDKGLISRIYKELQLNNKKPNNPI